jgi:uncharacterized OB-fold protein
MNISTGDIRKIEREPLTPFFFSRPFWEATRQKKLVVQFCRRTGQYQFYPRPTSIFTGRRDIEWREVSGRGEVFSFTVARLGRGPFHGHEPYLIATVRLDVGVNVIGNVVNCSIDDIHIGMKVIPYWTPVPDGTHLLMFEPEEKIGSSTAVPGSERIPPSGQSK